MINCFRGITSLSFNKGMTVQECDATMTPKVIQFGYKEFYLVNPLINIHIAANW
jgi:hypothetical protein